METPDDAQDPQTEGQQFGDDAEQHEEAKSDREDGGPTADEQQEDVSGGAHGTKAPNDLEAHS